MALEKFKDKLFRTASVARIDQANEIIAEYQAEGYELTLRQLYYQFVSRGLIENNQREYDKLGRLISDARLAGLIDWSAIVDRTRFLRGKNNQEDPETAMDELIEDYSIDMWSNQPERVEVWIEKDALVGVIANVCGRYDVDYLACRGYVSQSEQRSAGRRIENRLKYQGQNTIILHLGDHDPSGIDMTRDNNERLDMFARHGVLVKRLALNMNQVKKYKPPPNPAKVTDSRAHKYIKKFGKKSWELDALEPRVINKLLEDNITKSIDPVLWAEREAQLAYDLTKLETMKETD